MPITPAIQLHNLDNLSRNIGFCHFLSHSVEQSLRDSRDNDQIVTKANGPYLFNNVLFSKAVTLCCDSMFWAKSVLLGFVTPRKVIL